MKLIVDTGDIEIPQNIYEYTLSNMLYDMIQDENNDVRIKPITLCQDCKKWKTIECSKTKMLADIVRNSLTKYAKLVWPDHDDFCKDGEPKEIP